MVIIFHRSKKIERKKLFEISFFSSSPYCQVVLFQLIHVKNSNLVLRNQEIEEKKIDRVGPVVTNPSPTRPTTLSKQNVTYDT